MLNGFAVREVHKPFKVRAKDLPSLEERGKAGMLPGWGNAFPKCIEISVKNTSVASKIRKSVFLTCSRKERRPRARRWHRPLL